MSKKIYIGSDHAGFALKEKVKVYLIKKSIGFEDLGNTNYDPDDDYPDFAAKVAKAVNQDKTKGILICGSSHGVSIAANKFKGIRAVAVNNKVDAKVVREDNDANIICISGGQTKRKIRGIGLNSRLAYSIIGTFLNTNVLKVSRHKRRRDKITAIEKKNYR